MPSYSKIIGSVADNLTPPQFANLGHEHEAESESCAEDDKDWDEDEEDVPLVLEDSRDGHPQDTHDHDIVHRHPHILTHGLQYVTCARIFDVQNILRFCWKSFCSGCTGVSDAWWHIDVLTPCYHSKLESEHFLSPRLEKLQRAENVKI